MTQTNPNRCTIIAMANQKGGTGKTTSAYNLGVALLMNGMGDLEIYPEYEGSDLFTDHRTDNRYARVHEIVLDETNNHDHEIPFAHKGEPIFHSLDADISNVIGTVTGQDVYERLEQLISKNLPMFGDEVYHAETGRTGWVTDEYDFGYNSAGGVGDIFYKVDFGYEDGKVESIPITSLTMNAVREMEYAFPKEWAEKELMATGKVPLEYDGKVYPVGYIDYQFEDRIRLGDDREWFYDKESMEAAIDRNDELRLDGRVYVFHPCERFPYVKIDRLINGVDTRYYSIDRTKDQWETEDKHLWKTYFDTLIKETPGLEAAKQKAWEAEQVEPTIKVDDWIYHRPTSQAGQVVGLADQDNNIRVQFDDGVGVVSAFDVDIEHHELKPAEVATPDRKPSLKEQIANATAEREVRRAEKQAECSIAPKCKGDGHERN